MAATRTFLQVSGDATNQTTYNFTSINFGTAAADRYLVIAATGRDEVGGGNSFVSITIGGVAAAIAVQQATSGNNSAIAIAAVPTGTSGNVDIVFSSNMGNCDFGLWSTSGVGSTTPTNFGSSTANPGTFDLDIDANGVAFGLTSTDIESATVNTWAGLTEDWDAQQSSLNNFGGASLAPATTQTNLTCSATRSSNSRPTFVVASFPPAADSGPANLKSLDTNLKANIKSYNTNVIANVKSINTNA